MIKTLQNRHGFSLVELLIVITILGVLATIAVPLFLGQRTKAAQQEARSQLTAISLLETRLFADAGCFAPNPVGAAVTSAAAGNNIGGPGNPLPRFQPGNVRDLMYVYTLTSTDATPGDNCPDGFRAVAVPRAGSTVDGTMQFFIDNTGQNNF